MAGSIGEIKPGITLELDGNLYIVIDNTHTKVANRRASAMSRVRNLKTGQTLDITLRDSDNFNIIDIEKRDLQFSYQDGDVFHFLDMETYEDTALTREKIADNVYWLKDNMKLTGLFHQHHLINLEPPLFVEMKIIKTEPGYRGDTVKAGTKSATLETGLVINVPLFLSENDMVKVDTRTKEYMSRA